MVRRSGGIICFGAEGALGAMSWLQSADDVSYAIASVAGVDLQCFIRFPWPFRRGFVTFLGAYGVHGDRASSLDRSSRPGLGGSAHLRRGKTR